MNEEREGQSKKGKITNNQADTHADAVTYIMYCESIIYT